MRGQRLFIRPIETADHDAVSRFLETQSDTAQVPACGLLGKLVGELVSVVAMQITAEAIQIDDIVVARELRRKRIGRVMLDEVEQIAAKMDRPVMTVEDRQSCLSRQAGLPAFQGFFRRVGFEREGTRWIRQVRSRGAERAAR